MPPLLTPQGAPISPERPNPDFGENNYSALAVITNAVVVPPALFVPRGSDLKEGDKFTFQDTTWFVRGPRKWDMDQPFTGDDLGFVEFEIGREK